VDTLTVTGMRYVSRSDDGVLPHKLLVHCDLCPVGQLGYNAAKTRTLVGQWRLDLVGLERKLQHELDEGPQTPAPKSGGKRSRGLN